MRRLLRHFLAFRRRGVAGADGGPYFRQGSPFPGGQFGYLPEGRLQVLFDVVREGFEGGNIDDLGGVGKFPVQALPYQPVNTGEKRRQRLAGAGGGRDQRVTALGDGRPALGLGLGRLPESLLKPLADHGMELGSWHVKPAAVAGMIGRNDWPE